MFWKLPNFKFREPEDAGDEKLLADVRARGWHIVAVPGDALGSGFAFTVGLYLRTLQPEILIMGVPPGPSGRVLNAIGDYLVKDGEIIMGRRYDQFVDGKEVIFRPIARRHYDDYLGYAMWFYRPWPDGFLVVQCIWPDTQGIFPHESGFDEKFRAAQIDLSV